MSRRCCRFDHCENVIISLLLAVGLNFRVETLSFRDLSKIPYCYVCIHIGIRGTRERITLRVDNNWRKKAFSRDTFTAGGTLPNRFASLTDDDAASRFISFAFFLTQHFFTIKLYRYFNSLCLCCLL